MTTSKLSNSQHLDSLSHIGSTASSHETRYLVQCYRLLSHLTFCAFALSHIASGSVVGHSGSNPVQSQHAPARYLVQCFRLPSHLTFCALTLSHTASGSAVGHSGVQSQHALARYLVQWLPSSSYLTLSTLTLLIISAVPHQAVYKKNMKVTDPRDSDGFEFLGVLV